MRFTETDVAGAYLVEMEPHPDDRGFFARTWCRREFAAHGLAERFEQMNVSFNPTRGTLRGMHFQTDPHAEGKLVRATAGAVWDVALDLRPESPTYLRWYGVELSAANRKAVYIPAGCAHGYQTLMDDSEVSYAVTAAYEPTAATGVAYDDPAFGIRWPLPVSIIGGRDTQWPRYTAGGADGR